MNLDQFINVDNLKTAAVVGVAALLLTQSVQTAMILAVLEYVANTFLFN